MRLLFAVTTLVAAAAALIIGSAVAWTSSTTANGQQASAGTISVATYDIQSTGSQLYPTGIPIQVLKGGITNNTTANPGIAVHVRDPLTGSVSNLSASGSCSPTDISSTSVNRTDGSAINPGGVSLSNLWAVSLTMATGANDNCQGQTFTFDVTVNVET